MANLHRWRAALAGVFVVGLAVAGVWYVLRSVGGWVPRQRPYLIAFQEIALEPPPPGWFRGGGRGFLDRVRTSAPIRDETLSVLDCDLEKLKADFQKCAWVKRVVRVRRFPPDRSHPARLAVALEYREPVAVALFPKRPGVMIDDEAVILPVEDVDPGHARRLIRVHRLAPPFDPRPGQVWKVEGTTPGISQANPRAVAAARLAAFFLSIRTRWGELGPPARTPILAFNNSGTGPFVTFAGIEERWLLWREGPDADSTGDPDDAARWETLRQWVREHGLEAWREKPYFLQFIHDRLILMRGVEAIAD